jgi:hypothetical protein
LATVLATILTNQNRESFHVPFLRELRTGTGATTKQEGKTPAQEQEKATMGGS